jgi:hypothetical protein
MRRTIGSLITAVLIVTSVQQLASAATPRVPVPKAGAVNTITCNNKASRSYYTDPMFVPVEVRLPLLSAKCKSDKLPTQIVNGVVYQFEAYYTIIQVGGYGPGSSSKQSYNARFLRS